MEENIVLVLVEGKHDSAVLNRLLKENGFKNFSDKKINELSNYLQGYFHEKLRDFTYEDESRLWELPQLPKYIRYDGKTWFLFFEMKGDTKAALTIDFLKPFKTLESDFDSNHSFTSQQPRKSLLFFYDADESLEKRKEIFVSQYESFLPSFTATVKNDNFSLKYVFQDVNEDGFNKVGLFVYGENGTLEDLILPLMKESSEDVFESASQYLNKYMENGETNKGYGKALIGTVGQIEKPGKANQVIFSDTKMLNKSKFDQNSVFQEILTLFHKYA